MLRIEDVAEMLGFSKSYVYKLVSNRAIPHYKPTGKIVFFKRDEVEAWAFSGKVFTSEELQEKTLNYCNTSK